MLKNNRVRPGMIFVGREFETLQGSPVAVPDADRMVHLQFRRFAGCPVCDLHLRSFVRRHHEIRHAGILEVVLFHSSREELLHHASGLPFVVIPDPGKKWYEAFGVESSVRALLDPSVWFRIVHAIAAALPPVLLGRKPAPSLRPEGGRFGLPADFLIAKNGLVIAAHYGVHANDQWSVDDVLELTRAANGRQVTVDTRNGDRTKTASPVSL